MKPSAFAGSANGLPAIRGYVSFGTPPAPLVLTPGQPVNQDGARFAQIVCSDDRFYQQAMFAVAMLEELVGSVLQLTQDALPAQRKIPLDHISPLCIKFLAIAKAVFKNVCASPQQYSEVIPAMRDGSVMSMGGQTMRNITVVNCLCNTLGDDAYWCNFGLVALCKLAATCAYWALCAHSDDFRYEAAASSGRSEAVVGNVVTLEGKMRQITVAGFAAAAAAGEDLLGQTALRGALRAVCVQVLNFICRLKLPFTSPAWPPSSWRPASLLGRLLLPASSWRPAASSRRK